MTLARPLWDRLWEKVEIRDKSQCWPWIGTAKYPKGYGAISAGPGLGMRQASRVAYELIFGALASEQCACHRCDNPGCCNPWHMFAGTRGDNYRDALKKGRAAPGYSSWTHCKRGHAYAESDRVLDKRKGLVRCCKECRRTRDRKYWAARRRRAIA